MIFVCDRCGHRYSVPDERVGGRAFRVTCKSCGNVIAVRPGAPVPASGPAQPPAAPPTATAPTVPVAAPTVKASRPPLDPFEEAAPGSAPPAKKAHDTGRGLTTAEMAWMSDEAERARGKEEDGAEVSVEIRDPERTAAAPPAGRRSMIPKLAVAGAVLVVLAAGATALMTWAPWSSAPPPKIAVAAPPPAAAAPSNAASEKPAAPPPAAPAPVDPPAAATPVPAAAPRLASTTEPATPKPAVHTVTSTPGSRVGPGAHFEPGTVTVAKARRKEQVKLAGKDRRLLDLLARKQDEVVPPERIEKLALDTALSLDAAAVERVMAESQGAFSGCVTRAAKSGAIASSARRATLLLTVAGSGQVTRAWVAEAELSRTSLGKCLATAGRRLAFPSFEGDPVDVSVPLTLEAR